MSLVAPIALLAFLLVIFMTVMFRFTPEQLLPFFRHRNSGLLVGFGLFTLLLVVHLFSTQPWLADVLKVLIGALLGVSAAEASKSKSATSAGVGVAAEGATFGDYAEVAGRDINKTIERMQNDIAHFKDAVVNQYQSINAIADSLGGTGGETDYLLNTIYERGTEEMTEAVKKVVSRWSPDGWRLRFLTSDYT